MPGLREAFLAMRPWSWTMTVFSVLIGVGVAYYVKGWVDPLLSLVAVIGAIFLHAMVNVLNDYFDYKRGLDEGAGTAVYRPHPVIHGIYGEAGTLMLGLVLGFAALGMALAVFPVRPLALPLAALGFVLAWSYNGPPLSLKYRGLGEVEVFLVWGPLQALGGYYMAVGEASLLPVLASIPAGLAVASVLAANNLRDLRTDALKGIRTVATVLGEGLAEKFYVALVLAPYPATVALVALGVLPPLALATLITLPLAVRVAARVAREKPAEADPLTAKTVTLYLALLTLSIYAARLLGFTAAA